LVKTTSLQSLQFRSVKPTVEFVPSIRRSQRSITIAVIAAACGLAVIDASAADAATGKAKAQPCALCHGPVGISTLPDAPNLAAQPAIYVAAQLRAFRSGKRRHEVMNVIAKPLTDDDIDSLAAWFASIRIEAQAPP
jgi:cytochrome c553